MLTTESTSRVSDSAPGRGSPARLLGLACGACLLAACAGKTRPVTPTEPPAAPFAEVVQAVQAHLDLVVLRDESGQAQVVVAPGLQGRVLTATDGGPGGLSHGWVNVEHIRSGQRRPNFNPWGGSDRFWLGPEASRFALYFDPGAPFTNETWRVPPVLDTEAWPVVDQSDRHVVLERTFDLVNWSGVRLSVRAARTVRLLDRMQARAALAMDLPEGVSLVAYESENLIGNAGSEPWTAERGLPSVWVLGMLPGGPRTHVVLPIRSDEQGGTGPLVNTNYFVQVPPERVRALDTAVVFKGDGRQRGKIGVPPGRARAVLGSWDPVRGVLNLAQFTLPEGATAYVESRWGADLPPHGGDVSNSYNDGPLAPGALGERATFYELESSSPAAALRPGDSLTHVHRTMHLRGDRAALDAIAQKHLGLSLAQIEAALP